MRRDEKGEMREVTWGVWVRERESVWVGQLGKVGREMREQREKKEKRKGKKGKNNNNNNKIKQYIKL